MATPVTKQHTRYFNPLGSVFVERVTEDTEGAVKRTTAPKTGQPKTVWEIHFEDVGGRLTSIEVEETDFGKKYKLGFNYVGELHSVSIPVESRYGDSLMNKIGSVDLTKDFMLKCYSFTPKGEAKKREGLNIFQDGVKLPYYFTQEDPKGKPAPEENMDADDWKIYNIKARKFYAAFIKELDGKLKQSKPAEFAKDVQAPQIKDKQEHTSEESSDLPFVLFLPLALGLLSQFA
jgi:hypothetical protein